MARSTRTLIFFPGALALIAVLLASAAGAQASPARAKLASRLAQQGAGQVLRSGYAGFAEGYGEGARLEVLPCSRLRTRHRPEETQYIFHCSVAVFEGCVFVAPDFSSAYSCAEPRPYKLADEDLLAQRGTPMQVVPWWYDEMPPRAFEPAGNGYLHPWCTGPAGIEITVTDRPGPQGEVLQRSKRPFVLRPEILRFAPWKCPLGPFEPVS